MRICGRCNARWPVAWGLVSAAMLLAGTEIALGQSAGRSMGGTSSRGSSGGSFGGSSSGGSSLGGTFGTSGFGGSTFGSSSGLSGGTFGGSSGGGFGGTFGGSGGMSGSNFSGSRMTSNTMGNRTGGSMGGRFGTTGGVSSSNPFASTYGNPFAMGLSSSRTGRSSTSFGSAIYGNLTSGTGMYGGSMGGLGSASFRTSNRQGSSMFGGTSQFGQGGFRNTGMNTGMNQGGLGPLYTIIRPSLPRLPGTMFQVRPDLREVLTRTDVDRLPSRENIQVGMEGHTVVLRGPVKNDYERRLAEALIRLSPGVTDVRNELEAPSVEPGP